MTRTVAICASERRVKEKKIQEERERKEKSEGFDVDSFFTFLNNHGGTAKNHVDIIGDYYNAAEDLRFAASMVQKRQDLQATADEREINLAIQDAVRMWKNTAHSHGYPLWDKAHYCDSTCSMEHLLVAVHRKRKPDGSFIVHGHTRLCTTKHGRDEPQVDTIRFLYICKYTGAHHLCGPHCNLTALNTHESWICPATQLLRSTLLESEGETHKSAEGSMRFSDLEASAMEKEDPLREILARQQVLEKIPSKKRSATLHQATHSIRKATSHHRRKAVLQSLRKQQQQQRLLLQKQQQHQQQFYSPSTPSSSSSPYLLLTPRTPCTPSSSLGSIQTPCMVPVVEPIREITSGMMEESAELLYRLLFSNERLVAEKENCDNHIMNGFRNMYTILAQSQEAKLPVLLPRLLEVYHMSADTASRYPRNRFNFCLPREKSPPPLVKMKMLSYHYSKLCLDFWIRILNNTPMGNSQPTFFPQRECVVGIVYMMKHGHSVTTNRKSADGVMREAYVIVPRDKFLEHHLPDASELKKYDINPRNFTVAKNCISNAINQALTQGADPMTLTMPIYLLQQREPGSSGLNQSRSSLTSSTASLGSLPPSPKIPIAMKELTPRSSFCTSIPDEAFVGHDVGQSSSLSKRVEEYHRRCKNQNIRPI